MNVALLGQLAESIGLAYRKPERADRRSEMPQRVTATLPDQLAAELQWRADVECRSAASIVRLAVRQLLFASDGPPLGRGWRLEKDWRGLWATREKPGHPGVVQRVRLEDGPGAEEERPIASMELRE